MRNAAGRHHASRPTTWEVHSCGRLEGRFASKEEAQEYIKRLGKPGVKLTLRQIEIEEPVMQHATKKKSSAQLQREIDEVLAGAPTVKCPSPEHPLYPELRHIRQVAHDTSWTASQLAKDAEDAFRNGDCEKAATMLEAAKRVIAKERRKRPRAHATIRGAASAEYRVTSIEGENLYGVKLPSGAGVWFLGTVDDMPTVKVGDVIRLFHEREPSHATKKSTVAKQVAKDMPRRGARVKRAHATTAHPGKYLPSGVAGRDTRYVVTVPPTREMGSYKTRVHGPMSNARRDALWDYNSARRHDDLPPVDRMPSGTKYTKEG